MLTSYRDVKIVAAQYNCGTDIIDPAGSSQSFTWNSLGQLTQVTTDGQSTTFSYDGFGRRIRRVGYSGTVHYVYDGADLVRESDASGAPLAQYTYYPGVDNPHGVRQNGQSSQQYYYATEEPGNVVGLIDANNQLVSQYKYTPGATTRACRRAYRARCSTGGASGTARSIRCT